MVHLCKLLKSYDNLVIALESKANELTLEFLTTQLLHEELRKKGARGVGEDGTTFITKHKKFNIPTLATQSIEEKRKHKRTDLHNYCKKHGH
jgi:hypothetical protein